MRKPMPRLAGEIAAFVGIHAVGCSTRAVGRPNMYTHLVCMFFYVFVCIFTHRKRAISRVFYPTISWFVEKHYFWKTRAQRFYGVRSTQERVKESSVAARGDTTAAEVEVQGSSLPKD